MRAYSLSPCIHISLWSGFQGVHGKENALSFYACEAVSATVGLAPRASRSIERGRVAPRRDRKEKEGSR